MIFGSGKSFLRNWRVATHCFFKEMILGSGKSIFRNWRMAMADLLGLHRLRRLFCCWARRVAAGEIFQGIHLLQYPLLRGRLLGKKKFGSGKSFF